MGKIQAPFPTFALPPDYRPNTPFTPLITGRCA